MFSFFSHIWRKIFFNTISCSALKSYSTTLSSHSSEGFISQQQPKPSLPFSVSADHSCDLCLVFVSSVCPIRMKPCFHTQRVSDPHKQTPRRLWRYSFLTNTQTSTVTQTERTNAPTMHLQWFSIMLTTTCGFSLWRDDLYEEVQFTQKNNN